MYSTSIRFKDVSGREKPCFVVRYKLAENLKSNPFQGFRISLAYEGGSDFFCDVFPEFKYGRFGNHFVKYNQPIPNEGYADMWIFSMADLAKHKEQLRQGATCYFYSGDKLLATCEIIDIHLNCSKKKSPIKQIHNTNRLVHDIR